MGIALVSAGCGTDAAAALRDAVIDAKAGDPLAPVTVVVPTNYVGVAARRRLARGTGGGIAGVSFLTLWRLAELLGAASLAAEGRRPVSTPVLGAALRSVLERAPGRYAPVARHEATEAALAAAYRELSRCDDAALDGLAASGARAHDVVRVFRAARDVLRRQWYDETDLVGAALDAVAAKASLLHDVGAVVLFLPDDVAPATAALVRAVAETTRVTVVAGFTGVVRADTGVREVLDRLGVACDEPAVGVPHGTRVVSVSDPDDEVRAVVRMVFEALDDGVPLHRMAILYGATEPYARLAHEQLTAAGLAHNGAAVTTAASSVFGRGLLGLIALGDRDFHRQDVMALLASVPVRSRSRRSVPSARWERISRRAGIVRGGDNWEIHLERYAGNLERELAEELAVPDREPRPERFEHELAATRELQTFVRDLRADLAAGAREGATWAELVGWAARLAGSYLPGHDQRAGWPEEEREAADQVDTTLERLRALDSVEAPPGLDVFRRTLALELEAGLGRSGHLGEGILVGHVAVGLGLDLDRVFVCGLAEGTLPARVHDDSLLPDADRVAALGQLALRAASVDRDQRALLTALASASEERVLLFPRGDLRRTSERMPSRFLLDTVEALSGSRPSADELAGLHRGGDAPWLTEVASFASGVAKTRIPATEQEYRLRALGERGGHGTLRDHHLVRDDEALDRALASVEARDSAVFTRYDGNLGGLGVVSPAADGVVVSPTRLEAWARSPHAYLMQYVLRVEIPELPEEIYELSPLDRGSLVHEVLDRFLRDTLADGGAPAPARAWNDADRARLRTLGQARCDEYEAAGLTGRRVFWLLTRSRILGDLDRFLHEDSEMREEHGLTVVGTELGFGLDGAPPLPVSLPDGRTLQFRGAADRVDRTDEGTLWVIDYKTGRPFRLPDDDPTDCGTRLQLPVYALAARAAFASEGTNVGASYWFVSSRANFAWLELELSEAVGARFDDVLTTIVDGIEHGVFPCRVDPPDSWSPGWRTFEDPDGHGRRDRYREWVRKRGTPELAAYVALSEPGTGEDTDDGRAS